MNYNQETKSLTFWRGSEVSQRNRRRLKVILSGGVQKSAKEREGDYKFNFLEGRLKV